MENANFHTILEVPSHARREHKSKLSEQLDITTASNASCSNKFLNNSSQRYNIITGRQVYETQSHSKPNLDQQSESTSKLILAKTIKY